MRFVGYGRMSSDRQNPKSAEDQLFEIKAAGKKMVGSSFEDTPTTQCQAPRYLGAPDWKN